MGGRANPRCVRSTASTISHVAIRPEYHTKSVMGELELPPMSTFTSNWKSQLDVIGMDAVMTVPVPLPKVSSFERARIGRGSGRHGGVSPDLRTHSPFAGLAGIVNDTVMSLNNDGLHAMLSEHRAESWRHRRRQQQDGGHHHNTN